MVTAASILRLHQDLTEAWHQPAPIIASPSGPLLNLVSAQHRENFDLWHEEDKARDPQATDASIAQVKHAIDRLNQRRNDLVEKMDEWLLSNLPPQNPAAPLNSEPPGLIIDRLSILALRLFHTGEEARRSTASEAHRQRNAARLILLEEQRHDLATCLDELLAGLQSGTRRFKLYRQLKMYNDPELNPAIYTRDTIQPPGS